MDIGLAIIVGLLLGAGIILLGQFTVSTGLLGRRAQTPPKPTQGIPVPMPGGNGPTTDKVKATAPTTP